MSERNLNIITIDGPAGSGKSTVAKEVAEKLNWNYLDTGAMYRVVCLKTLRKGIDPHDEESIVRLMDELKLQMEYDGGDLTVFLDGEDVSDSIRGSDVDQSVSDVAALPKVRKKLVKLQREMGEDGEVVIDGRDIGTVVFPDARHKFYLDAALEERARRRYNQLRNSRDDVSFDSVLNEIKKRDETDKRRDASPLTIPEDAHHIDTTDMSVEEVVNEVLDNLE